MKWIESTERLPNSNESVYIRIGDSKYIASWNPFKQRFFDEDGGVFDYTNRIEWLDESHEPNHLITLKAMFIRELKEKGLITDAQLGAILNYMENK